MELKLRERGGRGEDVGEKWNRRQGVCRYLVGSGSGVSRMMGEEGICQSCRLVRREKRGEMNVEVRG